MFSESFCFVKRILVKIHGRLIHFCREHWFETVPFVALYMVCLAIGCIDAMFLTLNEVVGA